MNITLQTDKKKRKKKLKRLRNRNKKWIFRKTLFTVTNLTAIFTVAAAALYAFSEPQADVWQGVFFVLLVFVPAAGIFTAGYLPWFYGRYTCAEPYSGRANARAVLDDDSLTYIYCYVGKNDPAAYGIGDCFISGNEYVYSIPKNNVEDLYVDENSVCHITGTGFLRAPAVSRNSNSTDSIIKDFSFVIDFDNENSENIILNWRKQQWTKQKRLNT